MVALNPDYAPSETRADAKNRVGGFFFVAAGCAGENRLPIRTATKEKTGYVYETASGRPNWLNRDPIEERGGLNLYGFVGNDAVNGWDLLGQTPCTGRVRWRDGVTKMRTTNPNLNNNAQPNGCGASLSRHVVPDRLWFGGFGDACNNHDTCYATCGSSRSDCDAIFYNEMRNVCDGLRFDWAFSDCRIMAGVYWGVVAAVGGVAFQSAQDDACLWDECCIGDLPVIW